MLIIRVDQSHLPFRSSFQPRLLLLQDWMGRCGTVGTYPNTSTQKSYCTGTPRSPVNQTIFLRGYSISVRPDSSQSLGVGQMMTSGRSTDGSKRRRQQSFHSRRDVKKLDTGIPYSHANRRTNTPVQISEQYKVNISALFDAFPVLMRTCQVTNPSVLINNHILERVGVTLKSCDWLKRFSWLIVPRRSSRTHSWRALVGYGGSCKSTFEPHIRLIEQFV